MTPSSVEPHGQEPVAPAVRRNPPKLKSSFAKASEDTHIPPRSGDRGFLRRRVKRIHRENGVNPSAPPWFSTLRSSTATEDGCTGHAQG